MPPKQVPASAKAAGARKQPSSAAAANKVVVPLPAKIMLYHLNSNPAIFTYYSDKGVDYAEVELHVNGALPPGTYRFALARDGMTILFHKE